MNNNGYLNTSEAGKILGVSSRTVVRWIHEGRLPGAFKVTAQVFAIPKENVLRLARQLGKINEDV